MHRRPPRRLTIAFSTSAWHSGPGQENPRAHPPSAQPQVLFAQQACIWVYQRCPEVGLSRNSEPIESEHLQHRPSSPGSRLSHSPRVLGSFLIFFERTLSVTNLLDEYSKLHSLATRCILSGGRSLLRKIQLSHGGKPCVHASVLASRYWPWPSPSS